MLTGGLCNTLQAVDRFVVHLLGAAMRSFNAEEAALQQASASWHGSIDSGDLVGM